MYEYYACVCVYMCMCVCVCVCVCVCYYQTMSHGISYWNRLFVFQ